MFKVDSTHVPSEDDPVALVGQAGQHLRHLLSYPVQNTATDGRRWPVPPFVPKDSGFDCAAEKRSGTCTLRSSPDPNSCLVVSVTLPVCGGHGQRERRERILQRLPRHCSLPRFANLLRQYRQDEYKNWPNPRRRDIHPPLLRTGRAVPREARGASPPRTATNKRQNLADSDLRGGGCFSFGGFPPPLSSSICPCFTLSSQLDQAVVHHITPPRLFKVDFRGALTRGLPTLRVCWASPYAEWVESDADP